jgi:hypothetical protein
MSGHGREAAGFRVVVATAGSRRTPDDGTWSRIFARLLGASTQTWRSCKPAASDADLSITVHRVIFSSKGTKNCARQAIEAGIPTFLIDSEKAVPKRPQLDDPRLQP